MYSLYDCVYYLLKFYKIVAICMFALNNYNFNNYTLLEHSINLENINRNVISFIYLSS